jgi:predicted RNase H-like nuclease (RuvC/YqgF family)
MGNSIGIASILISLIAAVGGWLAARESRKATTTNTNTSSRVIMEEEAYQRARVYDKETIERQKTEIMELREEAEDHEEDIRQLHTANDRLYEQNQEILAQNQRLSRSLLELQERLTRMQRGMDPDSTEKIRMRESDTNPMIERQGPPNGRE